jgi:hypothetical protein
MEIQRINNSELTTIEAAAASVKVYDVKVGRSKDEVTNPLTSRDKEHT